MGTSVGEVRRENQDRAAIARFTSAKRPEKTFVCFALCDGMGGMEDGARCAEIALSAFILGLIRDSSGSAGAAANAATIASNVAVHRQYRERGGTTLAAVVFFPRSAVAVTVGDSRVYQIGEGKKLTQISTDDTIEGELNRLTGGTSSRSKGDTFAGQLAQFIGIGEGLEPRSYNVNRGTSYLLTSDGIHGYDMSPTTLAQVVSAGGASQVIIRSLLQLSRLCGGVDNATAVYVPSLPANWSEPPEWSNGEWLELWDAFGKIEFAIDQNSATAQHGSLTPQAPVPEPERPTKAVKRTSSSRKKATESVQQAKRTSPAQGRLTIEIVDEKQTTTATQDTPAVGVHNPTEPQRSVEQPVSPDVPSTEAPPASESVTNPSEPSKLAEVPNSEEAPNSAESPHEF
jgi:serine/threonine protein phosphatase PrpC